MRSQSRNSCLMDIREVRMYGNLKQKMLNNFMVASKQ
jgi:hypothetical protein